MQERYGLSTTTLKWIAMVAMTIGHIGILINAPWHNVGWIAPIIFFFLIVEGFHYTRNRKRYASMLFIFAIIAQIPYTYVRYGTFFDFINGNMIFSLFLGLCSLWVIKSSLKPVAKIVLVLLCVSAGLVCDGRYIPLLILAFGLNRGSFKRQAIWYTIALICCTAVCAVWEGDFEYFLALFTLLGLPLLALYNGKKASPSTPAWMTNKWIFYVFYPAHLLVLGFLKYGLGWL